SGTARPSICTLPAASYSMMSSAKLRPAGSWSARAAPSPLRGSSTATESDGGAPGAALRSGTSMATTPSDLLVAPSLPRAERVSWWLPGGSGSFGTSTHSPLRSAVTRPISRSPSSTRTSAPGAARPAITASPCGLTRTTSKLGAPDGAVGVELGAGVVSARGGTPGAGTAAFLLRHSQAVTPAAAISTSATSPMIHPRPIESLSAQPNCAALPRKRRKLDRRLAEGGARGILRAPAAPRKAGTAGIEGQENGGDQALVRLLRLVDGYRRRLPRGGGASRHAARGIGRRARLWRRSRRAHGRARRRRARRR